MTASRLFATLLLVSAVSGALAENGPDMHPVAVAQTRAQVKADLARAIAAGDVTLGDSDRTLAEIEPGRYPKPAPVASLTRAEVQAELVQAIARGELTVGDSSRTLAEIEPGHYPKSAPVAGLTRAEVKAELAVAIAAGNLSVGDSDRTLAETFPQRYAAVRTVGNGPMAQMASR